MRVLYLNPAGFLGGAERVLLDLMASLKREAPAVEVGLVALGDGPLLARARGLGVATEVVPMPKGLAALGDSAVRFGGWRHAAGLAASAVPLGFQATRHTLELRRAIHRFAPDLIHSHGVKTHVLGALARPGRVPLVWHLHDFIGERPLMRRALRAMRGQAALAVANSGAVAEDARAALPGLAVETVWNAVDVEHFSPGKGSGAALDRLSGMVRAPRGTVRVGLVATFARWKGQGVFLRAAREVVKRAATPVRFYVVGGALYQTRASQVTREELEALVGELGIREHVAFVPFQPEPRDVYRALDVVVHASTQPEPFGLTIVEAMACGRAVVVSSAGGAAELFTEGRDAVGIAPGDVGGMAEAIAKLAADPARRRALGEAARATAADRFSRERLAREMLTLYRGLMR